MLYANIKIDNKKCPDSGYILAYTRREVIFERYDDLEKALSLLEEQDVLEIHLFDKNTEYRLLTSGSKRFKEIGYIETVADFALKDDEIYKQDVFIEKSYGVKGRLCVLNHVTYDDMGMASIDNYRMYVEGGE